MTKPKTNKSEAGKAEAFDVAIVGGGMVGLGCALAVAQAGLKVVLLESQSAAEYESSVDSFDDRTLVVNPASVVFWRQLGVWQKLSDFFVPIQKVHVSNQGHFGSVNFAAQQFGVDQLGAVVAAKDLVESLWQAVSSNENIDVLTSAKLVDFEADAQGVSMNCELNTADGLCKKLIKANLMVASDGARSQVRSALNLASQIKSYQRTALVCNVKFSKNHNYCAYERLTKTGPLALLPFHRGRCGLVWSVNSKDADGLLALSDDDLMIVLQKQLSYRMGKIEKIGRRSSYPVYQVKVPNQIAQSVVLMGNAAHSVSPVSAQGLNLAVRGIQRLVVEIKHAQENNQSLSDFSVLQRYQQRSQQDQEATLRYTDDLMTWFGYDIPWINGLRSLGLLAADALPAVKKHIFERAGGLKA